MSPVLLEVAVTVNVWFSLGAPELMPERLTVWGPGFSLRLRLANALSVGGWLTGLTVTVNVLVTMLLLVPPSLTVTVMVAVPLPFDTGVKVKEPVALGLV